MVSEKMLNALNAQIKEELYSEYLYLAMAAYLDSKDLEGFAHFFKVQAAEERIHAMKFYDYINDASGIVKLKALEEPKADYSSPVEIFELALEHEKFITSKIYDLVTLAKEEKDYTTEHFLSWYLEEQAEEEATMTKYLTMTEAFSDSKGRLFMLDQQLSKRPYPER